MKRKRTRVLQAVFVSLLVLFGLVRTGNATAQTAEVENGVLQAMAKIEQAAENLQAAGFSDLVLPQGIIIQNGKLFSSREEAQRAIEEAYKNLEKQEITFRRQNVSVVSPTVALFTAEADVTATLVGGSAFSATSAWSVLFVLTDGQWKVLHAHTSVPRR